MEIIRNRNINWWLGIFLFSVLILIIGVFSYWKVDFLLKGVDIKTTIVGNKNSSIIQIKGNAKNSVYLSLDGREIFINKAGDFSENVALLPGLSIVSLKAKDRFGKITKKEFKIIFNKDTKIVMLGNKIIN